MKIIEIYCDMHAVCNIYTVADTDTNCDYFYFFFVS